MTTEIIVPRLGWSMEEGAFVAWLKKDGEYVHPGDPLFSIEGDKAVQEIESIDGGFLRIAANAPKPGETIRVGDLLGHLVAAKEETTKPTVALESVRSTAALNPDSAANEKPGLIASQQPSMGKVARPRRTIS